MARIAEAFVEISAKTQKLRTGLRGAIAHTRAVAANVASVVTKIAKVVVASILAAIAAITAALTVLGIKAVRAFMRQEDAVRAMEAALRANGDEVDRYSRKLQDQAKAIQAVTKFGDEEVLQLFAKIRALGVNADALDESAKATIGLATALGGNIDAMARYVALARQGETTMLQRYLPALRGVTDEQEKFRIVMDAGRRGFQQAQDEARTTTGRMKQLKNAVGDLMESIGELLAAGSGGAFDRIRRFVEDVQQGIEMNRELFRQLVEEVLGGIGRITNAIASAFGMGRLGQNPAEEMLIAVTRIEVAIRRIILQVRKAFNEFMESWNEFGFQLNTFLDRISGPTGDPASRQNALGFLDRKAVNEENIRQLRDQLRSLIPERVIEERLEELRDRIARQMGPPAPGGGGSLPSFQNTAPQGSPTGAVQSAVGQFKVSLNLERRNATNLERIARSTSDTARLLRNQQGAFT